VIAKKELKELTEESKRLNQMAKDIVRVEYDGTNTQNEKAKKSYEQTMFEAYIIREGYSGTYAKDMTKEENENKWRKWNILYRKIQFLMFRNIAFELCLGGDIYGDSERFELINNSERTVEHLIRELRRVDSDVKDYEWDESKNDFSMEAFV